MFIVSSAGVLLNRQTHAYAELARVLLSGVCVCLVCASGWCVSGVCVAGVRAAGDHFRRAAQLCWCAAQYYILLTIPLL